VAVASDALHAAPAAQRRPQSATLDKPHRPRDPRPPHPPHPPHAPRPPREVKICCASSLTTADS